MSHFNRIVMITLIILLTVPVLFSGCGKQKRKVKVIFLSIDTLRGDHITPAGYKRDTSPFLDTLVKESAYFKKTYANSSWTMPSHMSMLSGTLPSRHGVNRGVTELHKKSFPILNDNVKLISELFKESNPNLKTVKIAKLPEKLGFERGFDVDETVDPFLTDELFGQLKELLKQNKDNEFFFFVHTWMVHAPYTASKYVKKEKLDDEKRKQVDHFRYYTPEERKEVIGVKDTKGMANDFPRFLNKNKMFNYKDCLDLYDGGISYVDHYVKRLTEALKEMGIYDDVLFIVTSDHGEHFDDHHKHNFYNYHGQDFYDEFIHVPLIMKFPDNENTKMEARPVSSIDIVPTILDYYDYEAPDYIQGESLLRPYVSRKQKAIVSEACAIASVERKMIRIGDMKYIVGMYEADKPGRTNWDFEREWRLFDLKKDPLEKTDLYKDEAFKSMSETFHDSLVKLISDSAAKFGASRKKKVDEKTIKNLKELGYIQ